MKSPGEANDRPSLSASREGVVILSEFVSSARVMGGAIIINPWKIDEVSILPLNRTFTHHYLLP
jgi:hypothetical protein